MTPSLTTRIAAHRARLNERLAMIAKATAGPWNTQTYSYRVQTNEGGIGRFVAEMMSHTSCERDTDATFIAAARTGWEESIKAELVALDALEWIRDNSKTHEGRRAERALLTILDRAEAQP